MTVSENPSVQAKPPSIEETELAELNEVRNWPPRKKAINFAMVCSISFIGHFSASVYVPAIPMLQDYFHADQEAINLSIAFFMITFSIGLLIMSPLSETFGRRPIYVGATFLYTVFSILTGISTHLGAFMAFRILQGLFSGVGLALGGGSCSDLYDSHARGRAMAFYVLCIIMGPAISPIIGGYTAIRLNWQWIFYILAMIGGVLFLLSLFFLQETLSGPPGGMNPGSLGSNFWLPWQVLRRPEFASIFLVQCTVFGWIYLVVVMLPTTLQSTYDLSTDVVSLVYLAGGVGDGLGALVSGFLSDRLYRLRVLRNRDMTRVEYRLIPVFYLSLPFILCGVLLYGWSTQARMSYYVPLFAYILYSFGSTGFLTLTNSYVVEAHHRHASTGTRRKKTGEDGGGEKLVVDGILGPMSLRFRNYIAISVSQFLRNSFAMLFTAISVQMYDQLSVGWVYTVSAATILALFPLIVLVYYQGPKWRDR